MGQTSSSRIKITPQDRAILDMKLQRDKLKQYQKRIQVILDREQEIAKTALAEGNKSLALTALRRRKYQASLLVKTDGQLETLQNLVSTIEYSLVEKDILFGLQQGNQVLKEIHKELNVESVEKLMSATADGIAYQREVDQLLVSKMTMDEEESVQAELAALQAEQASVSLPSVPDSEIVDSTQTSVAIARPQESPAKERVAIAA